jgi:predicted metal-binding protein
MWILAIEVSKQQQNGKINSSSFLAMERHLTGQHFIGVSYRAAVVFSRSTYRGWCMQCSYCGIVAVVDPTLKSTYGEAITIGARA